MSISDYEIQQFNNNPISTYAAATDIVSIVTAGEVAAKRSQLGLAALNVASFAGGVVLGQPKPLAGSGAEIGWNDIDESKCPIEQLSDALRPLVAAGPGSHPVGLKINWLKILSLVMKVLPLVLAEKE